MLMSGSEDQLASSWVAVVENACVDWRSVGKGGSGSLFFIISFSERTHVGKAKDRNSQSLTWLRWLFFRWLGRDEQDAYRVGELASCIPQRATVVDGELRTLSEFH